jgi:hypothetical protein
MDVALPFERRVDDVLSSFSSEVRRGLLRVLTLDSFEERARTIGRIWGRTSCVRSRNS